MNDRDARVLVRETDSTCLIPDGGNEEGRQRVEPTVNDDLTITLYGVGPKCPGCGGPTYAVTADQDAELPWWCKECNVRLDDNGNHGSQASFPAGSEP